MSRWQLRVPTRAEWRDAVVGDFGAFLCDHAANERKASAMAMTLVAHYPDRQALVADMVDLAVEELHHFRQVVRLLYSRGLTLGSDEKDPYVNQLRSKVRSGSSAYFLDRLLCAGVIEARGAERFALLGESLADKELARFYRGLAVSEEKHMTLFVNHALHYFESDCVETRMAEWLDMEHEVVETLPIRARLH